MSDYQAHQALTEAAAIRAKWVAVLGKSAPKRTVRKGFFARLLGL